MPIWLPFQPHRRTIVMRRGDTFALGVERNAADGGGMFQRLERIRPRRITQFHILARGKGDHAALRRIPGVGPGRDMFNPAAPLDQVTDGPIGGHAAQGVVVPPRQEPTRPRIGRDRQDRTIMDGHHLPRIGLPPIRTRGEDDIPLPRDEGDLLAVTRNDAAGHMGQCAGGATPLQKGFGHGRVHLLTHLARQLSKPRRSCGRLRLRPMNTRRDCGVSSAFHGPMKPPSAIICTA